LKSVLTLEVNALNYYLHNKGYKMLSSGHPNTRGIDFCILHGIHLIKSLFQNVSLHDRWMISSFYHSPYIVKTAFFCVSSHYAPRIFLC
jgi:hypothetical protein